MFDEMSKVFDAGASSSIYLSGVALAVVLALPMAVILLFAVGTPYLLALIGLLMGSAIGLILYIALAGRNMRYVLGLDEIRVDYRLSRLGVPYGAVASAEPVETMLYLKLFGGSWPGLHWGLYYAKDLGKVTVYSTRYRGRFALLTMRDGSRLLLSPTDIDDFLEALKGRIEKATPIEGFQPSKTDRRVLAIQMVAVFIAYLALVTYVRGIYPSLPETIPAHFGLDGQPNRWGHKSELWVIVGVAAVFPVLNAVLTGYLGKYSKGFVIFLGVVFLIVLAIFGGVINQIVMAAV